MPIQIDDLLDLEPWRAYERAMFNGLYYRFRPPTFMVVPDVRDVLGRLSLAKRQVDVAVYEVQDKSTPYLVVECKRYGRVLDVNDVGEFSSRLEDTGAEHGVLVCPRGFSKAGRNFAAAKGIVLQTLPVEEADRLNWREIARAVFPWDELQHPEMGDALHAINRSDEVGDWIERLETLPFEEWETAIQTVHLLSARRCTRLLRAMAISHHDAAWRYNAIRLLDELGELEDAFQLVLIDTESDPDVQKLLESLTTGPIGP